MPLPAPPVRPPSRCSRSASEAAQTALLVAQHAHREAAAPYDGFDLALLDAGTRTRLTAL